jgi:hypothetical protein
VFDEIHHLGFVQLHDYTHKSSVAILLNEHDADFLYFYKIESNQI